MSVLKKITGSLDQLSRAFAPHHLTSGRCKQCGRETRWLVYLARGYFRCVECGSAPDQKD